MEANTEYEEAKAAQSIEMLEKAAQKYLDLQAHLKITKKDESDRDMKLNCYHGLIETQQEIYTLVDQEDKKFNAYFLRCCYVMSYISLAKDDDQMRETFISEGTEELTNLELTIKDKGPEGRLQALLKLAKEIKQVHKNLYVMLTYKVAKLLTVVSAIQDESTP